MIRLLALTLSLWLAPVPALAQHDHAAMAAGDRWDWLGQGQLFLNLNQQDRKFTDFTQIESQNWGMVTVVRQSGPARLSAHAMFSAEPWTLRRLGSAQALQVGETLDGAPLLDYQHPHDLIMGLEARVDWMVSGNTTLFITGVPVGTAALGPRPFIHRSSAGPNPTRIAWQRGAWRAQLSSGRLNEPETTEPGDLVRSTPSLEYERAAPDG